MLMNIVTAKLYCCEYCCNTFLIFRLSSHIISSVSLGSLSTEIRGKWPIIQRLVHVQPTWNLSLKHVGIVYHTDGDVR